MIDFTILASSPTRTLITELYASAGMHHHLLATKETLSSHGPHLDAGSYHLGSLCCLHCRLLLHLGLHLLHLGLHLRLLDHHRSTDLEGGRKRQLGTCTESRAPTTCVGGVKNGTFRAAEMAACCQA